MLNIKHLSKTYESSEGIQHVLTNLDFHQHEGDSTAILGDSGSGKSTLLHIIAGLEKPTSGSVKLHSTEIWSSKESDRARIRRENMSIIFQQFNLIPSLNIRQNIEFHAKLVGKYDRKFVNQILERLGLTTILEKYPEQTSGGQQQRTAIARAIASKPRLILADEPTGNLDGENTKRVIEVLSVLTNTHNTSLVVATHSQALAAQLSNKFTLLNGRLTKNEMP